MAKLTVICALLISDVPASINLQPLCDLLRSDYNQANIINHAQMR